MTRLVAAALLLACGLSGCEREERAFRPNPVATETEEKIALSSLSAGQTPPTIARSGKGKEYENNAYHMSAGQAALRLVQLRRLPRSTAAAARARRSWTTPGSTAARSRTSSQTIHEGRPERHAVLPRQDPGRAGLADRGLCPLDGRHVPKAAAPGRNDDMHARPSENRQPQRRRAGRHRSAFRPERRSEAPACAGVASLSCRCSAARRLPGLAIGARSARAAVAQISPTCSGSSRRHRGGLGADVIALARRAAEAAAGRRRPASVEPGDRAALARW